MTLLLSRCTQFIFLALLVVGCREYDLTLAKTVFKAGTINVEIT